MRTRRLPVVILAVLMPGALLAGCTTVPDPPNPTTVLLSGTVVDGLANEVQGAAIVVTDADGGLLGETEARSDGAFEVELPESAPWRVTATPAGSPDTLVAICDESPCTVTPWSSLLTDLADSGTGIDADALAANEYIDIAADEDPFVLAAADRLDAAAFDAAAMRDVLADGGLAGWIAGVRAWLDSPDDRLPPPGVPRFAVSAAMSGGSAVPAEQQVPRSRTAMVDLVVSSGRALDSVSGCGARMDGTRAVTAPVTSDCAVTAGTSAVATGRTTADRSATSAAPSTSGSPGTSGNPGASGTPSRTPGTVPVVTVRFALTYLAGSGGTVQGASTQAVEQGGSSTPVLAIAGPGWRFTRWSDGSTTNPRRESGVASSASLTAQFERLSHDVAYAADAGGTITGAARQTILDGADASGVTAIPQAGYTFSAWSDGVLGAARIDRAIRSELAVRAMFVRVGYAVTYTAGAGGAVQGAATQTVAHGGAGTPVTAVPSAGYRFVSWSDGSTANPRTDQAVTAAIAVSASFQNDLLLAVGDRHDATYTTGGERVSIRNDAQTEAEYVVVSSNRGATAGAVTIATPGGTRSVSTGGTTAATTDAVPGARARRNADQAAYTAALGTVTSSPVAPHGIPRGVPQVGDTWTLAAPSSIACTARPNATGTVQFVGTNVIVVTDAANPVAGTAAWSASTPSFTSWASDLDANTVPVARSLLGALPDVDGNGRLAVFITEGLNRLDAPNAAAAQTVRYDVLDRLPQSECAASNEGEIVYMLAPDPAGSIGSNVRTTSSVSGASLADTIRATTLLLSDERRLPGSEGFQDPWLEDALQSFAVESGTFGGAGQLAPRANIALQDLTSGTLASRRVAQFNTYVNAEYSKIRTFLQSPIRRGIVASDHRGAAAQGGAWAYLRYAVDRTALESGRSEAALLDSLVHGPTNGLDAVSGMTQASGDAWMRDFFIALYLDDLPTAGSLGTTQPLTLPTWNYRSVSNGLGGFPLTASVGALAAGDRTSFLLEHGGTAAYTTIRIAAGATFEFDASANGTADYSIVRIR